MAIGSIGRRRQPHPRCAVPPYRLTAARPPRLVFDDHNAEYVLQKRAFLTDARRPRRWIAAAYSLVQWQKLTGYERRVCRTGRSRSSPCPSGREALQRLTPGLESDRRTQRRGPGIQPARRGAPGRRHGRQRAGLHRQDGLPPQRRRRALVRRRGAAAASWRRSPDARFYVVGPAAARALRARWPSIRRSRSPAACPTCGPTSPAPASTSCRCASAAARG